MSKGTGGSPFVAGRVIGGRYCPIEPVGQGAMGVVWSARDVTTGAAVALKAIVRPDPELRARMSTEARACSAIRHENVVRLFDVLEAPDCDPILVMELLSGETLAALLSRKRRLAEEHAAGIGHDVARALAAAHDAGVVHRDIKPANIFLHDVPGARWPVVKVLDFGVSKDLRRSDGMQTVLGGVIGSLVYMSPEQIRADPSIDGRSDVFSLGLVLYEMLTGIQPFGADADVAVRILTTDPVPILHKNRRIDPVLASIVMACLQRDRGKRPWPAAELSRLLAPFAYEGTGDRGSELLAPDMAAPPPSSSPSIDVDEAATLVFSPRVAPGGVVGALAVRSRIARLRPLVRAVGRTPVRVWLGVAAALFALAVIALGTAWWRRSKGSNDRVPEARPSAVPTAQPDITAVPKGTGLATVEPTPTAASSAASTVSSTPTTAGSAKATATATGTATAKLPPKPSPPPPKPCVCKSGPPKLACCARSGPVPIPSSGKR